MLLILNSVVRIIDGAHDGVYRVIASPPDSQMVFLYRLLSLVEPEILESSDAVKLTLPISRSEKIIVIPGPVFDVLIETKQLEQVVFDVHPKYLRDASTLTDRERVKFETRCAAAGPFLDHHLVCEALLSPRGIGNLIGQIRTTNKISRSSCYRLWELLCIHGFNLSSLNPRFDRCGAPGVFRHWEEAKSKVGRKTQRERLGAPDPFPQAGVTSEIRQKVFAAYKVFRKDPKLQFDAIYLKMLAACFAAKYSRNDDDLVVEQLPQGRYPNKAQVRRIINQETNKLSRKLSRTTIGFFNRNHRGLSGLARDGVAGPGHTYAIDSTVGDIYLRSRVNRAWSVGRPIVYVIVDVWSTAVVGFHVCLNGPSWETAKVALFSTNTSVVPFAELWKIDGVPQLSPAPSLPHAFLCDRGEYLSKGALATGERLGVNMQYNPSYRPDLKGVVEVLHRIAKDQQFQFLPGAIDARRKEIDLRANPRDSIFTLAEYVQYLSEIFAQYNFFSDRSKYMNTAMISEGVDPTPAGLWQYGHEVGIGYRKQDLGSRIMSALLPSQNAIVRKNGVYFGRLRYEAEFVEEKMWPAQARNFGVMEVPMSYFPGNNEKIWWQDPESGQMMPLTLAPQALAAPGLSFDEWLDAYTYQQTKATDKQHQRVLSALAQAGRTEQRIARAREETKKADEEYAGLVPTMRDAKSIELIAQTAATNTVVEVADVHVDSHDHYAESYDGLMAELFGSDVGSEK